METKLTLTSPVFAEGQIIPSEYTCDGENTNPPLSISGVPDGTVSLALVMHDPDVPKALKEDGNFDHWIAFNISPSTTEIATGEMVGVGGNNGRGEMGYAGPCPPPQYEPKQHRYVFKIYALDTELALPEGSTRREVEEPMQGHILATATLTGVYERQG